MTRRKHKLYRLVEEGCQHKHLPEYTIRHKIFYPLL